MQFVRSLKAGLAASVCLLPLQALAQTPWVVPNQQEAVAAPLPPAEGENWVTLGGQYQSGGSYYFGRYTGAVHPGFYGLGDFHLNYRDPWDSGNTRYFQADGQNLGFPDRSVTLRAGQQGTWGATFTYDGIPYYATDSYLSIWQPNGALVPGVAPGSVSRTSNVASRLWNIPLSTQRDIFTGTGKYIWGDWTFTGAIRHDHKEGLQANSMAIIAAPAATATTLAASGLGYFAQPIDYDMDRYDASLEYATPRMQALLGYTFSQFTDNAPVFDAVNPFAFPAGASAAFPAGSNPALVTSFYTAPPSNSAHQVKLMFGYNFSPTMRVNANFQYGVNLQNAPYSPANGNLNRGVAAQVFNGNSLNGFAQTVFGNVAFTAEPIRNLDLRLAYTINVYDNQTPRNKYMISAVDNATITTPAGGYFNLPFSYNHQTITAEGGYRILPQTKVSAGYQFDDTYRTYADASVVTENTAWAQVRSQVMPNLFASLRYSFADREAHNYNPNGTWTALCGGVACETEPVGLMLFYLASRTRNEVRSTFDWQPTEKLSTSLVVRFDNDNYGQSTYGMRNNNNISVGPDINYEFSKALSAHAFYTFQQIYYEQASLYASAGTGLGAKGTGFSAPWNLKTTDQTHTAGVTVDWQVLPDLKLSAEYDFAYGNTNYALGDGGYLVGGAVSTTTLANLNVQPLPAVTAMLNSISLRAEYKFRPNISLLGGYAYERFSYADYAYNVGATQYVNAFFPGSLRPNYGIHVVGAAVRYRF